MGFVPKILIMEIEGTRAVELGGSAVGADTHGISTQGR